MNNFELGTFLFSENGFLQGFAHFTENIRQFLFTKITIFEYDLSMWELFATAGIVTFVAILVAKIIL